MGNVEEKKGEDIAQGAGGWGDNDDDDIDDDELDADFVGNNEQLDQQQQSPVKSRKEGEQVRSNSSSHNAMNSGEIMREHSLEDSPIKKNLMNQQDSL